MSHSKTPRASLNRSFHASSPAVNEDYKIRISKLVDDFRANYDLQEMPLADLNNHERRYIHELAKKFGLKTKSHGKEPHRVLTMSKPVISAHQPAIPLHLPPQVTRELAQYFAQHPITKEESALQLCVTRKQVHPKQTLNKNITRTTTAAFTPATTAAPIEVLPTRMQLPVWAHREEILRSISENEITIISGETGSGKSTQVVQYLLDSNAAARVVCTQPRRLPCISLATRVVEERAASHRVLGDEVGYAVRFDSKYSESKTRLLFCTTGVALMKLQPSSSAASLFQGGITHLVLDEIHDRDANSDFLLVFCREMLARQHGIKIVLMSATLKVDSFLEYFSQFTCGNIQVEGRSFPVDAYFLEDVLAFTRNGGSLTQPAATAAPQTVAAAEEAGYECPLCHKRGFDTIEEFTLHVVHCSEPPSQAQQGMAEEVWENPWEEESAPARLPLANAPPLLLPNPAISMQMMVEEYLLSREDEMEVDLDLIVTLLETIGLNVEDTSVLVFLPGWFEITSLCALLEQHTVLRSRFAILPLHSGISPKEQWRVFDAKIKNKIICSTNIAETSVTIPDVEYVIDTCLVKEKGYDAQMKTSSLQSCYISKSSALQRRGRAGRCFHGTCFHLISRARFSSLPDFQVPEILRTPLEQICLQARAILPSAFPGSIARFLSRAMDAPNEQTVQDALSNLIGMGALTAVGEELTALGRMLSSLPMEPKLGKMLLLACFLESLDPALTLAVSSGFRDPFLLEPGGARNRGKVFLSKSIPQLGVSDHAAVLASVRGFEKLHGAHERHAYCQRLALSSTVLDSIMQMKRQVKQQLGRFGEIERSRENLGVVQALICSGTVPNLALFYSGKFSSANHTRIRLHASSCAREEEGTWFAFEEMVRNNRGNALRMASRIDPLIVVLFAGSLPHQRDNAGEGEQEEEEEDESCLHVLENGVICINAWAKVRCASHELAMQLAVLRLRLETSFLNAVERGSFGEEKDRAIARFVAKLIAPTAVELRPTAPAFVPQASAVNHRAGESAQKRRQ